MSNGGGATDEPEAFSDDDRVRRALEDSIDREKAAEAQERVESEASREQIVEDVERAVLGYSQQDLAQIQAEMGMPLDLNEPVLERDSIDDLGDPGWEADVAVPGSNLRFRRLPIVIGTGLVVGFIIFVFFWRARDGGEPAIASTEAAQPEEFAPPTTIKVGGVIQDDLGDFLEDCAADSPPVQGEPAWDIVEVLDEDDTIEITFGGDAEAYIESGPFNSGLSIILRTADGEFIDEITWLYFQGEVEFGPSIGRVAVRWEWADEDTIRFRFPEGLPEDTDVEVQSRVILEGGGFLCDGTGG